MVIDAAEGVAEQDAKIAGIAHERGKGVIIAVNKWDAVEKDDKTIYKMTEKIKQTLAYMPYAEFVFISAKTGQRAMQQPPSDKGRRLKIFYMTQISVKPPTFVVFVNDKKLMHYSYTRYIENQIRNAFGFRGTPLRFIIRERKEDK